MIVWLNGAFGAGKTTTAQILRDRLRGARIFDPEMITYVLNEPMRGTGVTDFQDWELWRTLTASIAAMISSWNDGPVLMPMTVLDRRYVAEIVEGCRSAGAPLLHFLLHVDQGVLTDRITASNEHPGDSAASAGTRAWRHDNLPRYVAALPWLHDECQVVDTTGLDPHEVADRVLAGMAAQTQG